MIGSQPPTVRPSTSDLPDEEALQSEVLFDLNQNIRPAASVLS